MSEAGMPAHAGRLPWHFWAVAIFAILWNAFGAVDYVLSQTANADYFAAMGVTAEQASYMETMPLWRHAVWAVGVWGAVLATLCLVLRRRWAVALFALSLLCIAVSLVFVMVDAEARALAGQMGLVMPAILFAIGAFEVLYAEAMRKRGVLR